MHAVISKLILHIFIGERHRLLGFNGSQLSIYRPQVIQQKSQCFNMFRRRSTGLNAIERRIKMAKYAFEARVMLIGRTQQNGACQLLARLRLHRQQALEAEHHVAVAELLAQGSILNVRGAGTLMYILRREIVVQGSSRSALTAIAPQTGKQ